MTVPYAEVIGDPISHSKSPALHTAAYAKLGIEIDYTAVDLTERTLPGFMLCTAATGGGRYISHRWSTVRAS